MLEQLWCKMMAESIRLIVSNLAASGREIPAIFYMKGGVLCNPSARMIEA